MDESNFLTEFTDACARKIERDMRQIARCGDLLTVEQLWSRGNTHCNSAANLILHLSGNVRQWILAGIAGEPFARDRPNEFAREDRLPSAQVVAALDETVRSACACIRALDPQALARRYSIQNYDVTGLVALFHVAEHFSFHTGQIVHITKLLRDVDLSLFDEQGHRRDGRGANLW